MKKKNFKWHYIYYLLALFDIAAISASLYLNHGLMNVYTESVLSNQKWADQLTALTRLSDLAVKANAPGNDVFDDGNFQLHRNNRDEALDKFNISLADIEKDLLLIIESPQTQALFERDINRINMAMEDMNKEANKVFGLFERQKGDKAGAFMASMDRKAANVLDAINNLIIEIQLIQKNNFSSQISNAKELRNFEIYIGFALFIMVIMVTIYGHKIANEFKKHQEENDEYNEALKEQSKELIESDKRTRSILEAVADGIILLNEHGEIENVNRAALHHLGISEDDILGKSLLDLLPEHPEIINDVLINAEKNNQNYPAKNYLTLYKDTENDEPVHIELTLSQFEYSGENKYTGVIRDITEQKQYQDTIKKIAHTDALTGLANRTKLNKVFKKVLANDLNNNKTTAFLLLDLDGFKQVNDTYGHPVGDKLLVEVSNRLKDTCRERDFICRLGGDEFALILSNITDTSVVENLASRIIETISMPYNISSLSIEIGTSIGVCYSPIDGTDVDELIRKADLALYAAKDNGKGEFHLYNKKLNDEIMMNKVIEKDLKNALSDDQLELFYQLQNDVEENKLFGIEALIRWNHPEKGLISPIQFIPVAEKSSLVLEIGRWVIKRACQDYLRLKSHGIELEKVACNVSARQFEDKEFVNDILDIIKSVNFPAEKLQIEITETVALKNIQHCKETIMQLKEKGITFAMDDFGTGHTSLNYLSKLPLDCVKIDKKFVNQISEDDTTLIITQSLIKMGEKLNISVIAEGIENIDTERALLAMGCHKMQGFFYYTPMCLEDLRKELIKNNSTDTNVIYMT